MAKLRKQDALDYHSQGRPGKIEVIPSKPYHTQRDLSLAYSPGVAEPCLAIAENPEDAYKYTAKRNLVAVISNGKLFIPNKNAGGVQSCAMSALENMLRSQNKEYHLENLTISHLNEADEIFFINAVDGIVPLLHWQNKQLIIQESKKIADDFQAFYYF